jgi:hypothetical protein
MNAVTSSSPQSLFGCFSDQSVTDIKSACVEGTLFSDKTDNIPKPFKKQLEALIGNSHALRFVKGGSAFSSASFVPGGLRKKVNVDKINFLVFDLDHISGQDLRNIKNRIHGLAYVAYTTFSHSIDDKCIRLILLISRPITTVEFELIYPIIGEAIGGIYDRACFDYARIFFLPSTNPDRIAHAKINFQSGAKLDADRIIAAAKTAFSTRVDRRNPMHSSRNEISIKYRSALINGCEVFCRLSQDCRVRQLRRNEGWFLVTHEAQFESGLLYFMKTAVGWGKTAAQVSEIIDYANRYAPHTCQWAQRTGICKKSRPDACMKSHGPYSPNPSRFVHRQIKAENCIPLPQEVPDER